jgi:hypothetical protein
MDKRKIIRIIKKLMEGHVFESGGNMWHGGDLYCSFCKYESPHHDNNCVMIEAKKLIEELEKE